MAKTKMKGKGDHNSDDDMDNMAERKTAPHEDEEEEKEATRNKRSNGGVHRRVGQLGAATEETHSDSDTDNTPKRKPH